MDIQSLIQTWHSWLSLEQETLQKAILNGLPFETVRPIQKKISILKKVIELAGIESGDETKKLL